MSPLPEVAQASLAFTGPQGGPAYCGVLFAPLTNADRASSVADFLQWWDVYKGLISPYVVTGTFIALQHEFQWLDPTTGEILEDDRFAGDDLDAVGAAAETQTSRAAGVRVTGYSTERVNNRRVRTGWVVPYIGQEAIDDNGQVEAGAVFSCSALFFVAPGADSCQWAAWHRPVYERDNDGKRVLKTPGVAYSAGQSLTARKTVAMLRSRRD